MVTTPKDLEGNVGIGTTAPQSLFQVYGGGGVANLSAETGMLKVTNSSANELSIGTNPGAPFEGWIQVKRSNNSGNWYPLALQPAGGKVGIGTTAPAQALDIGSGNIKMGYYTPGNNPATVATSLSAQTWSSYVTVCPGNGFVISASCWASMPFSTCPWAVNASGQLAAFNCNPSASANLSCNFICANIR